MKLSPKLYHWLIRPPWITELYINNLLQDKFNLQNKKVLDFGCGVGASCSLVTPENYLGIDPDPKRIKYAKDLYPNYQFQVLKEDSLEQDTNSFNYIFIISVLHHIPTSEIIDSLQQISRVLKPNGQILVIEPCLFSDSYISNYFMDFFDNGNYIRTRKEYFKLFGDQDYQVNLIDKYKKLFFYNEIFFSATKK
ncbi:hypothetical protein JCM16358_05850 [Halanaerocella petrolearia]